MLFIIPPMSFHFIQSKVSLVVEFFIKKKASPNKQI